MTAFLARVDYIFQVTSEDDPEFGRVSVCRVQRDAYTYVPATGIRNRLRRRKTVRKVDSTVVGVFALDDKHIAIQHKLNAPATLAVRLIGRSLL